MTFDNRVMLYVAIGDKRKEYIASWVFAHSGTPSPENMAYWAGQLEKLNDAEIALRAAIGEWEGN